MMKLKITWAHIIIIALLSFMIFILSIIFYVFPHSNSSFDLVSEDYYNQDLYYQKEIDAKNNANAYPYKPTILKELNEMKIDFPDSAKILQGKIQFYRPSDKNLDSIFVLRLNNKNEMYIPISSLTKGEYDLKLFWTDENKEYLIEKKALQWN